MEKTISKKILFDYFDGKSTSIQKKMIEEWLKIKENQEHYYSYLDQWESENTQYVFDAQKSMDSVNEKLNSNFSKIKNVTIVEKTKPWRKYIIGFSSAASIILLSWFAYKNLSKTIDISYEKLVQDTKIASGDIYEKQNTGPASMHITLPDESSLILEPNSKISYSPQSYNKTNREVILSGQAFFEVQKNSEKPFFVFANNIITKVLGTSFTIKTDINSSQVIVKTGKVAIILQNDKNKTQKISGKKLEGFVLNQNEQINIQQSTESLTKPKIVKQHELLQPIQKLTFDFDETPAIEILELIKNAYHVEIKYNAEKLSNCKLTAQLSDEPLLEKIKLICLALDATFEVNDSVFIIKSHGC